MVLVRHVLWFAVTAAFLGGCSVPMVKPEDSGETCRVLVEEKFGQPSFRPNPLSHPGGALSGAAQGALAGLTFGLDSIVMAPLGTVIGGIFGTACAIGSAKFPNADADFQAILRSADGSQVKREIDARLNGERAECVARRAAVRPDEAPGTVVTIEKLDVGMACLDGKQKIIVSARWRAVIAKAKFDSTWTTQRLQTSPLEVGEWFARPADARAEIESALREIGKQIASRLVGEGASAEPARP